jgi:transcriptional regulator GlxA family with amidase domain
MVGYDDAQVLDITGPLEVFSQANRVVPRYDVGLASLDGTPIRTTAGLTLVADAALANLRGGIDTLLVAGGQGTARALSDPQLIRHLRRVASSARRVGSVCTGAFLLAEAGLLDGRRATTHWSACAELADRYPAVTVEEDPIYTRDGNVWTSAGVTAGIDLALALVEDDLGRDIALGIARQLVLFLRRPGSQSQFSSPLAAQVAERDVLREIQQAVVDRPGDDHAVAALASRAGMSPRHFARSFADEVGTTPARYVEGVRIETARRLLEETGRSVEEIARDCGFGTAETMRRTFLRKLRVAPSEYRRRFQSCAS